VKRYQRNEDDIRKLDAKYGSLVNMIQGLGQKHQPMLPSDQEQEDVELERTSNERVENWANNVSADGVGGEDEPAEHEKEEEDRESRFDRPLKEIRVGESPSRPWGISVPIFDPPAEHRPVSPPPAPVSAEHMPKPAGKCPFGHGQVKDVEEAPGREERDERPAGKCPVAHTQQAPPAPAQQQKRPAGKCPFGHGQQVKVEPEAEPQKPMNYPQAAEYQRPPPVVQSQPAFIQTPDVPKTAASNIPQMIFTGPVFISYPMEQAMAFMQQYNKGS
jgi:hypothetical protein